MDPANCELACGLVSKSYIAQGQQALAHRHRLVKALLSTRRWARVGLVGLVGVRVRAGRHTGVRWGAPVEWCMRALGWMGG